jgi:hypothetical protein
MSGTVENPGGEKEGTFLILRPSELAVMRRMADKYPIIQEDRREVLDAVMGTLRRTDKPRTVLAAAKVVLAMEQVNHQELRTYLEFAKSSTEPQQIIINNENQVSMGDKEKFLARATEYNSALNAIPEIDPDGGNGLPMDSAQAPPSPNGIHAK